MAVEQPFRPVFKHEMKLLALMTVAGSIACLSYQSLLPMWPTMLMAACLLMFLSVRTLAHRGATPRQVAVTLVIAAALGVIVAEIGKRRSVEHVGCAWRMVGDQIEVDLKAIAGGPNWVRVRSKPLLDSLSQSHDPTVRVEVTVVRNFGKADARGLIRRVNELDVNESF